MTRTRCGDPSSECRRADYCESVRWGVERGQAYMLCDECRAAWAWRCRRCREWWYRECPPVIVDTPEQEQDEMCFECARSAKK